MTEEELRKEATSTVEWKCTPMIDRPTFINGYITSAKPREKRIAELEAQIEKMKCCENCEHYDRKMGCLLVLEKCVCMSKWEIKEND